MEKECKRPIVPEHGKMPKIPFCLESGVGLKPNGDGSFVCPPECGVVRDIIKRGRQISGNGKS